MIYPKALEKQEQAKLQISKTEGNDKNQGMI